MKKWIYVFLFMCLPFYSCEEENADDLLQESEELIATEEYFRAEINGRSFEVTDPEAMGGTIYPSPESGIITFDLYGGIEEGESYEGLDFKICFFKGPGTYYTGTTTSVSWADYYHDSGAWYNDYRLEDPGVVTVTEHTEEFVQGTFIFNAYNYEDESYVNVEGEFKVLLEENVFSK